MPAPAPRPTPDYDRELRDIQDRDKRAEARAKRQKELDLDRRLDNSAIVTKQKGIVVEFSRLSIADFRRDQQRAADDIMKQRQESAQRLTVERDDKKTAQANASHVKDRQEQESKTMLATGLAAATGGMKAAMKVQLAAASAQLLGDKKEGDVAMTVAAAGAFKKQVGDWFKNAFENLSVDREDRKKKLDEKLDQRLEGAMQPTYGMASPRPF
jgi:hypothetical protein